MDLEEFARKLEQYVGKKFKYEMVGNTLKVYTNNEICYGFDCNCMKIELFERNAKTMIKRWNFEKFAKMNFAMLMRNIFGESGDSMRSSELDECDCLERLNFVVSKYIDEKYYSKFWVGPMLHGFMRFPKK